MMNINDYFEQVRLAEGYDAMCDKEDELYAMWENDFDAFEAFCTAEGIDLTAKKAPEELETIFTYWIWDMCDE